MPLHHYLPATYLAFFSNEQTLPRRERRIAVGDKKSGRVFRASAAKVGAIQGFYACLEQNPSDPQLLERSWADYETNLARTVEELVNRHIDAVTWAGVLVPFVAGLLVRGPDFNKRFERRIGPLRDLVGRDNTNQARLFELQRLLGPVLAAKWVVMTVQGEGSVITNDIGFAPFRSPQGEVGLAIPVGHRHLVGVIPCRSRAVVAAKGGKWWPIIQYVRLRKDNHDGFNSGSARQARRFIFGVDEATVTRYLSQVDDSPPTVIEPYEVGFIYGPLAVVHEFTWHRLVSVLAKSPDHENAWRFDFDWQAVASVWKPVVIFPLNLPEFPPALRREGDVIYVDFYEVEGFTTRNQ
jgi:hypothetical protein